MVLTIKVGNVCIHEPSPVTDASAVYPDIDALYAQRTDGHSKKLGVREKDKGCQDFHCVVSNDAGDCYVPPAQDYNDGRYHPNVHWKYTL